MFRQALFWVLLMFVCASFADADEYSDMAEHLNVTRDDLVRMHGEFVKIFPSDMTLDNVQRFFVEQYSLEESRRFVRLMFDEMDEDKNYLVDFHEYVQSSMFYRGNRLQHLAWAFNAFDNHKHGYITDHDLFIGLRALHDMTKDQEIVQLSDSAIHNESKNIIKALVGHEDGHVSKEQLFEKMMEDGYDNVKVLRMFDLTIELGVSLAQWFSTALQRLLLA